VTTEATHVHAVPRQAELEALKAIDPHIRSMKVRILLQVGAAGDHGLTPDEYQRMTLTIINTVRRRFTDLWKDGFIRPTDRVRPNARGNNETVWVLGRDENAVKAHETKDEKIARLEARIRELEGQGKQRPQRYVYLPVDVTGDFPFNDIRAVAGLYERHENPQGAVSVMVPDGRMLGVKPGEFVDAGGVVG
jgi:hypothetical protein